MSLRAVAFFLVVSALTALRTEAGTRVVTKDLPAAAGTSLTLETYRGSIELAQGDSPTIHIELHLDAPGEDDKDVERRLDRTDLAVSQQGSAYKVDITDPQHSKIHFDWVEDGRLDINVVITVPRNTAVTLSTKDGGITAANITGAMVARAQVGSIFYHQVVGSVDASTRVGGVIISRCSGDVKAETRQGDIQIGRVGGYTTAKTFTGDLEIQQAVGGVDAYAEAGGLICGFPKAFIGAAKLRTSGGSISAKFDLSSHCTIDASSVWGHVRSSLPLIFQSGSNNSSSVKATLNGGGPAADVHANGGNVFLLPGTFIDET